jgi:hypothetical protein
MVQLEESFGILKVCRQDNEFLTKFSTSPSVCISCEKKHWILKHVCGDDAVVKQQLMSY